MYVRLEHSDVNCCKVTSIRHRIMKKGNRLEVWFILWRVLSSLSEIASRILRLWRWRQYVPPNVRQPFTRLHVVIRSLSPPWERQSHTFTFWSSGLLHQSCRQIPAFRSNTLPPSSGYKCPESLDSIFLWNDGSSHNTTSGYSTENHNMNLLSREPQIPYTENVP
jgi:hypothetical protein